jgi:hypothetical protein
MLSSGLQATLGLYWCIILIPSNPVHVFKVAYKLFHLGDFCPSKKFGDFLIVWFGDIQNIQQFFQALKILVRLDLPAP